MVVSVTYLVDIILFILVILRFDYKSGIIIYRFILPSSFVCLRSDLINNTNMNDVSSKYYISALVWSLRFL